MEQQHIDITREQTLIADVIANAVIKYKRTLKKLLSLKVRYEQFLDSDQCKFWCLYLHYDAKEMQNIVKKESVKFEYEYSIVRELLKDQDKKNIIKALKNTLTSDEIKDYEKIDELIKEEETFMEIVMDNVSLIQNSIEKERIKKPYYLKTKDYFICKVCNHRLNEGQNYCDKCGQKIGDYIKHE